MPTAPPNHAPRKGKAPRHNVIKNRQQHRAMNTGSKAWRQLRLRVLVEESFKCRACGKFGDHVDHIDGQSDAYDDYRRDNLQCLCLQCHSAKTMRESNAKASQYR